MLTLNPNFQCREICFSILTGVALLLPIASTSPCSATEALRKEIRGVSEVISKLLKKENQSKIVIDEFAFKGGTQLVTSASLIKQIFVEEFKQLEPPIEPVSKAAVHLSGTFRGASIDLANGSAKKLAVVISIELTDSIGSPITSLDTGPAEDIQTSPAVKSGRSEITIVDERTAITVLQPAVDLPPQLSPKERTGAIIAAMSGADEPHFIRGSQVFASKTSPYGIEIRVKGKVIVPVLKDGEVFIDLNRGDEYEVVLLNDSPFDAAAVLNIDGINSFAFSKMRLDSGPKKGQPLYSTWVLTRKNVANAAGILGWHIDNETVDAFVITRYAESASASLNQKNSIGTIQAVFSAAWPKGTEPPTSLNEPNGGKDRGLPDATGRGKTTTQKVTPTEVEIGVVRASVEIRYSRTIND